MHYHYQMVTPKFSRTVFATLMGTTMVGYAMGFRLKVWMQLKRSAEPPAKFLEHCIGISREQVANHGTFTGIRRVSALKEASAQSLEVFRQVTICLEDLRFKREHHP